METNQIQFVLALTLCLACVSNGRSTGSKSSNDMTCKILVQKLQIESNSCLRDICKNLIKKLDSKFCRKIEESERIKIYDHITKWTERFIEFDADDSVYLDINEFLEAISVVGIYNHEVFEKLYFRFKNKEENISYENFIRIAAHLTSKIDEFHEKRKTYSKPSVLDTSS